MKIGDFLSNLAENPTHFSVIARKAVTSLHCFETKAEHRWERHVRQVDTNRSGFYRNVEVFARHLEKRGITRDETEAYSWLAGLESERKGVPNYILQAEASIEFSKIIQDRELLRGIPKIVSETCADINQDPSLVTHLAEVDRVMGTVHPHQRLGGYLIQGYQWNAPNPHETVADGAARIRQFEETARIDWNNRLEDVASFYAKWSTYETAMTNRGASPHNLRILAFLSGADCAYREIKPSQYRAEIIAPVRAVLADQKKLERVSAQLRGFDLTQSKDLDPWPPVQKRNIAQALQSVLQAHTSALRNEVEEDKWLGTTALSGCRIAHYMLVKES